MLALLAVGAARFGRCHHGRDRLGRSVIYTAQALLVRERPFIRHPAITLEMPPLDRYSFPSGHTLHAVCFTWQAVAHFPALAWVLVPMAA